MSSPMPGPISFEMSSRLHVTCRTAVRCAAVRVSVGGMGIGRLVGLLAVMVTPYAAAAQGVPPSPPRARLVEELRLDAEEHDFPAVTRVWVEIGRAHV